MTSCAGGGNYNISKVVPLDLHEEAERPTSPLYPHHIQTFPRRNVPHNASTVREAQRAMRIASRRLLSECETARLGSLGTVIIRL